MMAQIEPMRVRAYQSRGATVYVGDPREVAIPHEGWGGKCIPPATELCTDQPLTSAVAARTLGTVAGLTAGTCALWTAQLSAALNFFGHRLHLLLCGKPASAIAEVPALRSRRPEQAHIERLQFVFQRLQLSDSPSGVRDLVSDQVTKAATLGVYVDIRAAQELMDLMQGQTQPLGPLNELDSTKRLAPIDAIAGLGPLDRLKQADSLVVAQSRGGNACKLRQLPDMHCGVAHGVDPTPSTGLEGQALPGSRIHNFTTCSTPLPTSTPLRQVIRGIAHTSKRASAPIKRSAAASDAGQRLMTPARETKEAA